MKSPELEYNNRFRTKLIKILKEKYNCTNEILSNSEYEKYSVKVYTTNKNTLYLPFYIEGYYVYVFRSIRWHESTKSGYVYT